MAAVNSKQSSSRSFLIDRCIKTMIVMYFICFIFTIGYTCSRYDEIMKVCEEQDLEKTWSTMPFQFMEMFQSLLQWCGVTQTGAMDLDDDSSNFCSQSWFYILQIIFFEKFPRDVVALIYKITKTFKDMIGFVSLHFKTVINFIILSTLSTNISLFVIISLIVFILVLTLALLWKLISWRRNPSSGSLYDQSYDGFNNCYEAPKYWPSETYKSLQLTPASFDRRLENKAPPRSSHLNFSMFKTWMILLIIAAILLSIPWEFLRLYQKAVASHAARVMKGLPPQCTQTSMSWLEKIQFLLRWHFSWSSDHDVCQEYYYASMVDPMWEVNPLLVLSSVLTQGMLHPLEAVSSSLGRSVRAFFSEIPVQWQPLIMLVALVTFVLLLLMTCRYRLAIPMFLRIEPKTPVTSPSDREREASKRERSLMYNDLSYDRNLALRLNGNGYLDEERFNVKDVKNDVFPNADKSKDQSKRCSSLSRSRSSSKKRQPVESPSSLGKNKLSVNENLSRSSYISSIGIDDIDLCDDPIPSEKTKVAPKKTRNKKTRK